MIWRYLCKEYNSLLYFDMPGFPYVATPSRRHKQQLTVTITKGMGGGRSNPSQLVTTACVRHGSPITLNKGLSFFRPIGSLCTGSEWAPFFVGPAVP